MKKACQRTTELKRKATDVHEKTRSHRARCRRATNEHTRSEAAVNHSLGCLGWFVNETAAATHSVTCGMPDRESNEVKYFREAGQRAYRSVAEATSRVPPVDLQVSEHEDAVLVERPR